MLLKGTRTGVLTVGALDILYQQGQDGEQCCPVCCGQCWVLQDMLHSDELDSTVRKAPESMYETADWWDDHTQTVRRSWLKSRWPLNPTCHTDEEEDDDAASDAA